MPNKPIPGPPPMGEATEWARNNNGELHWGEFSELPNFDDSCITVAVGFAEPRTYWAKADGVDEQFGGIRYKLLPMDRG